MLVVARLGSVASADVWVDPAFTGTPDETERAWRTVLIGGLRQGGHGYFALDDVEPAAAPGANNTSAFKPVAAM